MMYDPDGTPMAITDPGVMSEEDMELATRYVTKTHTDPSIVTQLLQALGLAPYERAVRLNGGDKITTVMS